MKDRPTPSIQTKRNKNRGDENVMRMNSHQDGIVAKVHGVPCTALDARGAVQYHVFEPARQFRQYPLDAAQRERVLIPSLARGEHVQSVDVPIGYQGLIQIALAVEDVDEVEHDATLDAEVYVEIAQSHVEIDDARGTAPQREAASEGCGGRRLAHPALAGSDAHHATATGGCGRRRRRRRRRRPMIDIGGVGEHERMMGWARRRRRERFRRGRHRRRCNLCPRRRANMMTVDDASGTEDAIDGGGWTTDDGVGGGIVDDDGGTANVSRSAGTGRRGWAARG
jgi:hypothetical protein